MDYINIGKNGECILSDGKNQAEFDFLEMYVLDGKEYAVLQQSDDDMITIMRFFEAEGKNPERYSEIEDDEIFNNILALYNEDID